MSKLDLVPNDVGGKDITDNKVYRFFEGIWQVFVLNALCMITCLGIVTILPSFVACYQTFKDIKEEDEVHYIKKYFGNFALYFKDSFFIGLTFIVIFVALFYGYFYYSDMIDVLKESGEYKGWDNFYSIMLGLIIVFFMLFTFLFVQMIPTIAYFKLKYFDYFRFVIYMGGRYFGWSLIDFIIVIANVLLMLLLPYLIFVLGFSLHIDILYLIERRRYWFAGHHMVYEEEESLLKDNENVVREDYEDNNKTTNFKEIKK